MSSETKLVHPEDLEPGMRGPEGAEVLAVTKYNTRRTIVLWRTTKGTTIQTAYDNRGCQFSMLVSK